MARERYLLGVDPEELKKKPAPQQPQTPRGKWENFWYHYKWLTIGIIVAVAIVVGLTVQSVTRVEPDYMICMVTMQEVSIDSDARLEEILSTYAHDRNGDGKVRVEVRCLNVSQGDGEISNPAAVTNQQAVMGHILVRDVDLWAVAPEFYNGTLSNAFNGDPASFFMPLDTMSVPGISENGKYWNWEGLPILETDKELWSMPDTLYWGVRVMAEDADEETVTQVNDMLALLKAFAEEQTAAE